MKNNDWTNLIDLLALKYQTNKDKIIENLSFAIEKAYLKEFPDLEIKIDVDIEKNELKLFELRKVVEDYEDIDYDHEISVEDAIKEDKNLKLGDIWYKPVYFSEFERRMAIHVKQVFDQKMAEISNSMIYQEWESRIGTIIKAEVEENKDWCAEVNLGSNIKGVISKNDQIKNEVLEMGKKYFFYIKNVKESTKGWPIILSRNHAGLVEDLLQVFIDEIKTGQIEIKAIARVAGFKTKIAVQSNQLGIDPIGTCVGTGGERIKSISREINDEFIDFILWNDDLKQLIVNACEPHKLIGVEINDDIDNPESNHKLISLVLDGNAIPKLIGKDGSNIKLISKITNCTIEGIFSLEDAIKDEISYETVSHLYSTKPQFSKSHIRNFQDYQITDDDLPSDDYLNTKSKPIKTAPIKPVAPKPKKQVTEFEDHDWKEYEVKTFDSEIDEDLFDDIVENISVPKKTKVVEKVTNENIDDLLFESEDSKDKNSGPKYRKTKTIKKPKKDNISIFKDEIDDFDDITEDSLDYEDEIDFSDNLEIDEEE